MRKFGEDVYAVQMGDNKVLDRLHSQLPPQAPDPSERAVTSQFMPGDPDSNDDGEENNYTAERILMDKPDPTTPGWRLYKGGLKGFAASRNWWEPSSRFVPSYSTVLLDYLKKK